MIDFVTTIAIDLRGQYTVTYNSSLPEAERAIRMRSTNPDYQVRVTRDSSGKPQGKK
jgi:hypothetical protein